MHGKHGVAGSNPAVGSPQRPAAGPMRWLVQHPRVMSFRICGSTPSALRASRPRALGPEHPPDRAGVADHDGPIKRLAAALTVSDARRSLMIRRHGSVSTTTCRPSVPLGVPCVPRGTS